MSFPFPVFISYLLYSQISFTTNTNTYTFGPIKMTWYSANDWCLNEQQQLISIHSEEEYQLIKSQIPSNDNYWIGLRHNGQYSNKNAYSWSDNTPFDYGYNFSTHPWNDIEPNSDEQSCIRLQNNANYSWDDIPCNSTLGGQQCVPICQSIDTAITPTAATTSSTQIPTVTTLISTDNLRYPETSVITSTNVQTVSVTNTEPTVSVSTYDDTIHIDPTVSTHIEHDNATPLEAHIEEARVDIITTVIRITDEYLHVGNKDEHSMSDIHNLGINVYVIGSVVFSICCMIIIGLVLIKWSLGKHNKAKQYAQVTLTHSSSQVSMIPHSNDSFNQCYRDGVMDHKCMKKHAELAEVTVLNMKYDEYSDAQSHIDKATRDIVDDVHDVDTDESEEEYTMKQVTHEYIDGEHDGIISDDEDDDNDQEMITIHVIEGGIDENVAMDDNADYREDIVHLEHVNDGRVKTPKYANIAEDEFIVMGDDEDHVNDGLTRGEL